MLLITKMKMKMMMMKEKISTKTEIQKKLGANAKVKSVSPAPVSGLYEVLVGNDIFYTDNTGKYLIQGEIIELASGKNITEQRQADLNRIKWGDLNPANAIKNVRGNGNRQLAIFSDPNCGYCKRLEKSLQQLDNVTIYTYLIPILSPDSAQKSKQIWCSSDKVKSWNAWMLDNQTPSGQGDCATPLERNTALARKLGVTGTPAMFFADGSRISGAAPLANIEKKLK